jgi:hypothetical protein
MLAGKETKIWISTGDMNNLIRFYLSGPPMNVQARQWPWQGSFRDPPWGIYPAIRAPLVVPPSRRSFLRLDGVTTPVQK